MGKCERAFQRPAAMRPLSTATAEAKVATKKNCHLNMIANAFMLPPSVALMQGRSSTTNSNRSASEKTESGVSYPRSC
jgi:hypothetical protein